MLRTKFGRAKIKTNLLQRFDNNFCHLNNKFCHKVDETSYDFSQEIADCCLIRLATLLQKDCKYFLKFPLNIFEIFFIRKFVTLDKRSGCDAQGPGFESSLK